MKQRIILSLTLLAVVLCLASYGGGDSKNANSASKKIDEMAASKKHWEYENNGASLLSENYYVTDRGENVYGAIQFMETKVTSVTPEGRFCGLCISVFRSDYNQPRNNLRFDKERTSFLVSFNGREYISWPYFAPPNENTVVIGYYNEWEKHIRESQTCRISFSTENGQMDFQFNTKGFSW